METWKVVQDFDRYEVSNLGRVRNRLSGHILSQYKPRKNGQVTGVYVKPYRGGVEPYTVAVRRLVAAAFVPNPDGLRSLRNIDGDLTNNRADNLEWFGKRART